MIWKKVSPDRDLFIQVRQPLVLLGALLAAVCYVLFPNKITSSVFFLFAGWIGVSFWWSRELIRKVHARRILRYAAVQVGDELEERVVLKNDSFLSLIWVELMDRSDLPGYNLASVRAVGGISEVEWRTHAICERRGVFVLGPWELRTADPFHLFNIRQIYKSKKELLVYPPLVDLKLHSQVQSVQSGDLRRMNQPLAAETMLAAGTRIFQPGDPLRHVHWPTSARRNTLFVKTFEPEAISRIWLVPDCDARVHNGVGALSTLEAEIMLTATIAAQRLQDQLQVGLLAYGAEQEILLPQRSPAQLWPILRSLARLQSGNSWSLSEVIEQIRPLVSFRDRLVVLTPSLHPEWPQILQRISAGRQSGAAEVYLMGADLPQQEAKVDSFVHMLNRIGFYAQPVWLKDLRPVRGTYGEVSRWEFKALATGRLHVRHSPRLADAEESATGAAVSWKRGEPE